MLKYMVKLTDTNGITLYIIHKIRRNVKIIGKLAVAFAVSDVCGIYT